MYFPVKITNWTQFYKSLIYLINETDQKNKNTTIIHNIEFIEFAIEEKNLEQLENFLIMLGFKEIGKHKSKSIKLFIFDDVKIILNYEKDYDCCNKVPHPLSSSKKCYASINYYIPPVERVSCARIRP